MAGRAGRRGLDKVGSVLIPCLGDSFPPPGEIELRRVMTSPGARLESRFRLTPAMILNCARGEDLSVEALMRRSFAEFHAARAAPAAARRALRARRRVRQVDSLPWLPGWPRKEEVERYAALTDEADSLAGGGAAAGVAEAPGVLQALTPGRLVLARTSASSPATLAVVVAVFSSGARSSGSSSSNTSGGGKEVVLLALVEGEEWPLTEPEEDEDEDESDVDVDVDGKKRAAAAAPSPCSLPSSSPLVPLASKKKSDHPNPLAGMRVLSGKKSGDLNSQFAALAAPSSTSSSSSSAFSVEALKLPRRTEASGVPFALVAVAPRLVDAVLSEKLPHFVGEGIIVAAAAAAAAASAATATASANASLASSPAACAAALALSRARDEAANRSPPFPAPPLDPVSDLRVTGIEASAAARRRAEALGARSALLPSLPLPSAELAAALSRVRARRAAASRVKREALAAGGAALEALPEYSARVDALVRLGYLEESSVAPSPPSDSEGGNGASSSAAAAAPRPHASSPSPSSGKGVALKGRVAYELAAAHDGLALSEALFAGAFASLASPADAAALLSCYVFQERSKGEEGDVSTCRMPTPALEAAFATAIEAAAVVGRAHEEAGLIGREARSGSGGGGGGGAELLPGSVDEWISAALRPGMVHAVHAWASGSKFVEVCGLTEAMEGTIVRTVMRVDEVSLVQGRKKEREKREGRERERERERDSLHSFPFF